MASEVVSVVLAIAVFSLLIPLSIRSLPLRQSALSSARRWGLVALAGWGIALLTMSTRAVAPGLVDQAFYLAALLSLGAGIAVLGARRPGNQVWGTFVVFPMLLVLGWPMLFAWSSGWPPNRFTLMTPAFLASCLVLVMAVGNYLGTRCSGSAIGLGLAVLLVLIPRSPVGWRLTTLEPLVRLLAASLVGLMAYRALVTSPPVAHSRLERFWFDFRDTFGVVWTLRIQERINLEGRRLGWPIFFHLDGVFLIPSDAASASETPLRFQGTIQSLSESHAQQVQTTLAWIFRRFVNGDWIKARLQEEWSLSTETTDLERVTLDSTPT